MTNHRVTIYQLKHSCEVENSYYRKFEFKDIIKNFDVYSPNIWILFVQYKHSIYNCIFLWKRLKAYFHCRFYCSDFIWVCNYLFIDSFVSHCYQMLNLNHENATFSKAYILLNIVSIKRFYYSTIMKWDYCAYISNPLLSLQYFLQNKFRFNISDNYYLDKLTKIAKWIKLEYTF